MERMNRWFLWLIVIGPLHMIEQMFTSIEEFHMLRDQLGGYYDLFAPANADLASVILITIVVTLISLMLYGMLVGGRAQLVVVTIFGLMGAGEIHHVFQALSAWGYDPGVITCFAYSAAGVMLLREVWREVRFRRAGELRTIAA